MRDFDVRSALMHKLTAEFSADPSTKIVEEMSVWSGTVRIDVAVINGQLCGYELKSDRDTLDRLPLQAELYSRAFDRVELVVGRRHAKAAVKLVPKWWGITLASNGDQVVVLSPQRIAKKNPNLDAYAVAQFLWKEEALAVLESFDLAKGWRSKRIDEIHRRAASEISIDLLSAKVREALKQRQGWLGQKVCYVG